MCTSSSPKVEQPKEKKPVYMANPYLDGLGIGAESMGRNSLRIDMGSTPPPINTPIYRPPVGSGGSGGDGFLGLPAGGGLGIGRTRVRVR